MKDEVNSSRTLVFVGERMCRNTVKMNGKSETHAHEFYSIQLAIMLPTLPRPITDVSASARVPEQ
jgi:hypothetical protein